MAQLSGLGDFKAELEIVLADAAVGRVAGTATFTSLPLGPVSSRLECSVDGTVDFSTLGLGFVAIRYTLHIEAGTGEFAGMVGDIELSGVAILAPDCCDGDGCGITGKATWSLKGNYHPSPGQD